MFGSVTAGRLDPRTAPTETRVGTVPQFIGHRVAKPSGEGIQETRRQTRGKQAQESGTEG